MMREIYSRATVVDIWLGNLTCAPEAAAVIRKALPFFTSAVDEFSAKPFRDHDFEAHCQSLKAKGEPNLTDLDLSPLYKLLELPWWRRKWVIQETLVNPKIAMRFGSEIVSYIDLMHLLDQLHHFKVELVPDVRAGDPDPHELARYGLACATTIYSTRMFKKPRLGPSALLSIMLRSSSFQCADPRDHLYAVLGLNWERQDETFIVHPDYSLTVEETYTRFATQFLQQPDGDPLWILYYLAQSEDPRFKLPSWVPDWSNLDTIPHLSNQYEDMEKGNWFQVARKTKPKLSFEDDKVLVIQGLKLDTVRARVPPFVDFCKDSPEAANDNIPEKYKGLHQIKRWYTSCMNLALEADSPLDADFHAGLLCEVHMHNERSAKTRMSEGQRHVFGTALVNYVVKIAEALNTIVEGDEAAGMEMLRSRAFMTAELLTHRSLNTFCLQRSFFLTEGGRMGQGHPSMEDGDVVCVLYGTDAPYILRPAEDGTFTIVGHCYVMGIMDGEALDLGLPETDFRIR